MKSIWAWIIFSILFFGIGIHIYQHESELKFKIETLKRRDVIINAKIKALKLQIEKERLIFQADSNATGQFEDSTYYTNSAHKLNTFSEIIRAMTDNRNKASANLYFNLN